MIIVWVKYDFFVRECLFLEFLKCVRLFFMLKYSLWNIFEIEEFVIKNLICVNILYKGMDFFLFLDYFECMLLKFCLCLN